MVTPNSEIPLKLVIVEDNSADVRLILHELRQAGFSPSAIQVQDEVEFLANLNPVPDIILCDYDLPQFNGLRALELLRERQPDTPFLIVSGSIGEEIAVEAIKRGATDYLLKDRLGRLGTSIKRALEQRNLREAESRAQKLLGESESRLQMALESARMGVWEWNIRSGRVFWSPECYKLMGVESFDETFSAFSRFLHPLDTDRVNSEIQAAIAEKLPFATEFRVVRPDGQVRWLSNLGRATYDIHGRPERMVGTVQDITASKSAQEALKNSEEQYRALAESMPQIVWTAGPDGAINYLNQRTMEYTGMPLAELTGWGWGTVIHPDDLPGTLSIWGTALQTGEPQELEFRIRRADGEYHWHIVRQVPIRDRDGVVVRWFGTCTDIHDQKRVAASLTAVMKSVLDGVITINERGKIVSANPSVTRLFGYAVEEVVGQNVKMLMPNPYRDDHDGFLVNYLTTGIAKVIGIGREVVGRRKDGTTFPADLSVTEFELEGTRHFTGVIRDITARKKLEEQYLQSQKMEAIGQLAGGVAHDFNNLLTVINGYSEILIEDMPPENPSRDLVVEILKAGERSAELTRQLLMFSRKQVLSPQVLNLNAVVEDTEKMLRRVIGEDVRLVARLDPGLVVIHADPGQLKQLILNLAVNSRDAMKLGGQLTIETQNVVLNDEYVQSHPDARRGGHAMLSVSDTGCGMPADVRDRIFEPFFTTKGLGEGTGLGLAVVHGIVKQSSGHIRVYSEVGTGTTFKIYFPHYHGVAQDVSTRDRDRSLPTGAETILLVEDEAGVRALSRQILAGCGYQVLEASNGDEALRVAAGHAGPIHVLLTDVVMPGSGGRVVAELVTERYPGVRVVFMSGYTDDAIVRHGILQDGANFLQKPFSSAELAFKIRNVLDSAS